MTNNELSYWDSYSKKYNGIWDRTLYQKYLSSLELSFIKKYLIVARPIIYLDIGCGYGRILNFVAPKIHTGSKVFAVEPSVEMLKLCKENYPGYSKLSVINTDFLKYNFSKFPNVTFDLITAIRVLKYYNSYGDWFDKIFSLLSRDGIFIFTVTNSHSVSFFDKLGVNHFKISLAGLNYYLEKSGLEVLSIEGYQILPEFLYRVFNKSLYLNLLIGFERLLSSVLPNLQFKRVLYVAVRKKR